MWMTWRQHVDDMRTTWQTTCPPPGGCWWCGRWHVDDMQTTWGWHADDMANNMSSTRGLLMMWRMTCGWHADDMANNMSSTRGPLMIWRTTCGWHMSSALKSHEILHSDVIASCLHVVHGEISWDFRPPQKVSSYNSRDTTLLTKTISTGMPGNTWQVVPVSRLSMQSYRQTKVWVG